MTEQSYKHIEVELIEDGGLLSIRLASGKGNILDMAMMAEISGALDAHRDDKPLRMVLFSGGPRNFSFGASIEEHTEEKVGAMLPAFHSFIRKLASYPVVTAALVRGRCLGGAFELALACRLVFATPDAVFGCPEIKLGVFPPVLAVLGPQRLGAATAERLVLTGGDLDAATAERCGWLTQMIAGDGEPMDAVLELYRESFAPLSAFALRQASKVSLRCGGLEQLLDKPLELAEKQYLEEVVRSHDGNEGLKAFMEKRKPSWSHD